MLRQEKDCKGLLKKPSLSDRDLSLHHLGFGSTNNSTFGTGSTGGGLFGGNTSSGFGSGGGT